MSVSSPPVAGPVSPPWSGTSSQPPPISVTPSRPARRPKRRAPARPALLTAGSARTRLARQGFRPGLGRGDPEGGGATTYYVVVLAVVLLAVVGLVVDGGGMIHAYQRANDISREAARQTVQEARFDPNGRIWGGPEAAAAGRAYLTAQGCEGGTVSLSGTTATVTCPYSYDPIFVPGHYHVTGQGRATAHPVS
jgi:hypothetical protein